MSDNKAQPEPSMEEILSTIGRIITEDKPAEAKEEVLELTEAVGDDGAIRHLRPQPPAAGPVEGIVSAPAAAAAASAFGQLAQAERQRQRAAEVPIGSGGRTLEDLVRDMIRPMLQQWLDQHLPGLVERLVREEIVRLAGGAERR
jgi:cell pole-organizing protein PopZ